MVLMEDGLREKKRVTSGGVAEEMQGGGVSAAPYMDTEYVVQSFAVYVHLKNLNSC